MWIDISCVSFKLLLYPWLNSYKYNIKYKPINLQGLYKLERYLYQIIRKSNFG